MQIIGCPTCGDPLAEATGSCARCGKAALSFGTIPGLNETTFAQETLLPAIPGTPAVEEHPSLPQPGEFQASVAQEPGETESTIQLPRKVTRRKGAAQESGTATARTVSNAGELANAPREPDETEATIQLPYQGGRQPRASIFDPGAADATLQLPRKAIKRQFEKLQDRATSTLKFPFTHRSGRAGLAEDLLMPVDETAHNDNDDPDQDDELILHHETWQKVVSRKTTYTMPVVSARTRRSPSWFPLLLNQYSARSFFWLSTLGLVALLLGGAFGIAVSFGHTTRQAVPNPSPALLAQPATISQGGFVTLRGSHFTPRGNVALSRDQHISLVDTGGDSTIQADAYGSFSDTVVADPAWLSGAHTLYATDVSTHKQALVPVVMTGQNALQGPPHLVLSSNTLDLGSGDETTNANEMLALSNAGGGQVTWQASVSQSWLQITPQGGTIDSGKHLSVIVSASRAALAPGPYQATIVFTSSTGQNTLAVNMTVKALQSNHEAIMQLSTAALAFEGAARGSTPGQQIITISNPGILPLTWGANASNASWLWFTPSSGTIYPGSQQQITVGVTTNGLTSGAYKGAISFSNQGSQPVQGSPQSIYVGLTITPACTLTLSTGSLSFSGAHGGASPASKSLSIGVAQGCSTSQHWTATTETVTGGSWLTVSSSSGATPATVKVKTNTTGLAPGTYSGTVTVTSSLGSKLVKVQLTVTPIPCSVSGLSTLALQGTAGQANAAGQSVTINTSGDCSHALNWVSSVSGGSWLSATSTGALPSSTAVNIQADLASLSAGTYNGTVAITVMDSVTNQTVGTVTVSVTLTAQPPQPPATPCTLLAPSSNGLSFTASVGSDPATSTASFTISVTGSCAANVTLTPTVDSNSSWLSVTGPVTIASGSSATFTVTVTSATQAAGTYSDSVTLHASGGISGNPRTVTITLTVS